MSTTTTAQPPATVAHAVDSATKANDATPTFSLNSVIASPGSTLAGAAAILSILSNALQGGFPTTTSGWLAFGVTVATGVGAIFAKAGL